MEKKTKNYINAIMITGNLVCAVLLLGSAVLGQIQWGMEFLKYCYLWIAITVLLNGGIILGEWAAWSIKKRIIEVILFCIEVICLCILYYLLKKLLNF